MDRATAATTLLLWELRGQRDLATAAGRDGGRTLLSLVEEAGRDQPVPQPGPRPRPPDAPSILALDEERQVAALRSRLQTLTSVMRPDELHEIQERLERDLLPVAKIAAIRTAMERYAIRETRVKLQRDLESKIGPPRPKGLRAILLFSRDGRALAAHGEARGLDMRGLVALVRRGEAGSTWTMAHRSGYVVGHIGERAALVALFGTRPSRKVAVAVKASVGSLEQRERLLHAPNRPENETALAAYLRAVRLLLMRES